MTFCIKGKVDGEQGYLDSAYSVVMEELQNSDDKNLFVSRMQISAVLFTRDLQTLETKQTFYMKDGRRRF